MKTIVFFFAFFIITATTYSQEPIWYGSFDASHTRFKSSSIEKPYTFINPFVSKTFGKGNWGIFIEGTVEPGIASVSPGILYAKQLGDAYHEIGVGPGFEFAPEGNTTFLNSYYTLETKADDARAKNKLLINANYSYATTWGSWWLGYILYHPFNESVGIGIHSQRYGVTGPRIQYSFCSDKVRKVIWLAGWGNGISIGATLAVQSKQ